MQGMMLGEDDLVRLMIFVLFVLAPMKCTTKESCKQGEG